MPLLHCYRCNDVLDHRAVVVYARSDGTYGLWTPERAAHAQRQGHAPPPLLRMCPHCYIIEQNRALDRDP